MPQIVLAFYKALTTSAKEQRSCVV